MKKHRQLHFFLLLLLFVSLLFSGCKEAAVQEMLEKAQRAVTGEQLSPTVAEGEMHVSFLDVGQGDSTLIQAAGQVMLIDAGKKDKSDEILSFLHSKGITFIDYFILTHPDSDHIGGAADIINAVEVGTLLIPAIEHDTQTYEHLIATVKEHRIPIETPFVGSLYTIGDAKFMVLAPSDPKDSDPNNASIVIRLMHGKRAFLLCGDAEEKSEKAMLESGYELSCDVLKCGHHGSISSLSDDFLAAADPTWAVISCGKDNQYGHPHQETLAKLEDDDVQIYRTDQLGTIIAISDGDQIAFKTLSDFNGMS